MNKSKKSFYILKNINYIHIFVLILTFIKTDALTYKSELVKNLNIENKFSEVFNKTISRDLLISNLRWKIINNQTNNIKNIEWKKHTDDLNYDELYKEQKTTNQKGRIYKINSLNRSIVFNNEIIGPDISWLVPPGFKWTKKTKLDFSVRGHNRRKQNEPFLGWNGGDAVGQIYFHPINHNKYSYGLNLGVRSVYSGSASGGSTSIGEGLSLGFRIDKELSNNSGIALGAEQLIHFDGLTDTGRDLYITVSKGWWNNNEEGNFPLSIATFGFGTGKLAEGNIKGLCSEILGGSGTEVAHKRDLCWSPIFSLSRVYNYNLSSFFEYNSKWFLLGTSYAPFKSIPARGTFAIQLSDHINNYKLNNMDNLKWVFRLSIGF